MTELSFLIELLLNHKLTKATKDLIQQRIKEIESDVYQPKVQSLPQLNIKPQEQPQINVALQNQVVQQALAQREAIMRGDVKADAQQSSSGLSQTQGKRRF